jgi:hypothetical protein
MALAAATMVVGGAWWWTHPDRFEPGGGTFGMDVPGAGGSAVFGIGAAPDEGAVHLIDAEPVIAGDSTDGVVRVLVCHPAPGEDAIGAVKGPAEEVCARTTEARDAPLGQWTGDAPYLVVELTGRRPGTLTVEGVRLRYRSGWRTGDQVTGATAVLRVGGG